MTEGLENLKFLLAENKIGLKTLIKLKLFKDREEALDVLLGIKYIDNKLTTRLGKRFCVNKKLFLK